MLQFLFILISGIAGFTLAGYPDHTSGNDISSDGQSYGYGYSGSFSGTGPTFQDIPFAPGFSFNNLFDNLNKFNQNLFKQIQSQSVAVQNSIQTKSNFPERAGGYGGGYSFDNGNSASFGGSFSELYPDGTSFQFIPGSDVTGQFTPNGQGATAFGSVGSGGVNQGAFIYPENPKTPNVNVRFGSDQPSGGFKSVFTSSSSYTTNVNGQPKTVQKATTTVNDNGKITTYTRESPQE